ncbi:MAG: TrmH family RNA methyltransferase [Verrucomicrobia bacterium]|nr:TrmH family RNA methyltransferase [Verrucomicrobiota bacterium]MBU6445994.1 TrmH family RNA methyltransferase [Verrucomicrobiota bacterium]MDE3047793.1 TrmH family RNA methyltransferase [Verrucomicrobiota bacterium]
MTFTKRTFFKLEPKQRHKKCAELLRKCYEAERPDFAEYNVLSHWLQCNPYEHTDRKKLADRYHWHLQMAGLSLKEHNLLPSLRTGDREAKLPFPPIAIYLDNVRSAYNVGSILRTAEALRIGSVYFSEKTPFIDHEKVQRTAMGAAAIVPCFQNIPLKNLPRPIIALDTSDAAIPVAEFSFPKMFTLVLGNEEYGVSDESLQEADNLIEIPLFGKKNSINIACAFAIAASKIRFR